MSIKLNKAYRPILNTDKRYILITGGRGSQKSFTMAAIAQDLSYHLNQVILYLRYTLSSSDDSIVSEVKKKIEALEAEGDFTIKGKDIDNKVSGSKIKFRGVKTSQGNQTAKIKSIQGLSTIIFEEAEEFVDEDEFDKIDNSCRTIEAPNRVFIIMNSPTVDHFFWDKFFEGNYHYEDFDGFPVPISDHPDVLHIHTTYLINPYLSDSYLRNIQRLKEKNPARYGRKFIGQWAERAEGVIFENWTEGEFVDTGYTVCGQDYGYFPDPYALVRCSIDDRAKKFYVDELGYGTLLKNEMIHDIYKKEVGMHELVVSDTNEPKTTAYLRDRGYNVQNTVKPKGGIVDDIRDLQGYEIIVSPRSYNVKKELRKWVWNDRKASIPHGENNHSMHAMIYAFRRLKTPGVTAGYS